LNLIWWWNLKNSDLTSENTEGIFIRRLRRLTQILWGRALRPPALGVGIGIAIAIDYHSEKGRVNYESR
jgi:hypothetical protein